MALIELKLRGTPQVSVVTPGVPVPLSAVQLLVSALVIQWDDANIGAIYVKDEDGNVCAKLTSGVPAMRLSADDSEADEDDVVWDLNKIFVDADNGGDKVYLSYYTLDSVKYNS